MPRLTHSLAQYMTSLSTLTPQTLNTIGTTNGTAVARQGFSCGMMLANVASFSGTGTPTLVLKLQESHDGVSNWTDVPGTSTTYTAATTNPTVNDLDLFPRDLFLRAVAVTSGSTISAVVDVILVLSGNELSSQIPGGSF